MPLPLLLGILRFAFLAVLAAGYLVSGSPAVMAGKKNAFKVCWRAPDLGRVAWGYAQTSGIMKKWADKYGISVELVRIDNYEPAVIGFVNGVFDGCTLSNIEALQWPSSQGRDTTVLIVTNLSNGNDGVVIKGIADLRSLAGQPVLLRERSVAHYLLNRALVSAGVPPDEVIPIDTQDYDIVKEFQTGSVPAIVTWNPMLTEVLMTVPGARNVYDSAKIPGEIVDVMAVNTQVLRDNPAFGKALVGAWYEVAALMAGKGPKSEAVHAALQQFAGINKAQYGAQLAATKVFHSPGEAVTFIESKKFKSTMAFVRKFLFTHHLLAESVYDVDEIGISFPDGSVEGSRDNIKLRFDSKFMRMARDGTLLP